MNENIDLTKILKDCPKGWIFYSSIFGEVHFSEIEEISVYSIIFVSNSGSICGTTKEGKHYNDYDGECTLFPSKEQRDWSKFTASWQNENKFDPHTLKPYDKVLVRDLNTEKWWCALFSHMEEADPYSYKCVGTSYRCCIPFNNDTKHLVGSYAEAPEYYKYWED